MWNFEKHINIPSIRLKAYLYSILEDITDIPPGDEGEGNGHPGDALQELDWCLNQVSIIINLIILFLIIIIIIITRIIIVEIVTKIIIINSWRVWTLTRLWLIWLRASSRICSTGFTIWWQRFFQSKLVQHLKNADCVSSESFLFCLRARMGRWLLTTSRTSSRTESWCAVSKKHHKTCESCPVSLFTPRALLLAWTEVLNCLK